MTKPNLGSDLSVKMVATTTLRGRPTNPRTHSKQQIQKLVRSYQQFGWTNPILIDEANTILCGHGRWEAAIPGRDWPLAGTHRGHAGVLDLLETASRSLETSTEPREYVAQEDRVLVVGVATGRVKATNRAFEDEWIFAITVRDGKLASIREYVDTQALARASEADTSRAYSPIDSEAAERAT